MWTAETQCLHGVIINDNLIRGVHQDREDALPITVILLAWGGSW